MLLIVYKLQTNRDSEVSYFDPLIDAFTPLVEEVNLTNLAAFGEEEVFGITFSRDETDLDIFG